MNVDVVIPVRNGERFIFDCLQSIRDQTRLDFIRRVIVVNDGSTDNTERVVIEFQSKLANLELFNTDPHGLSAARNFGLRQASSRFVAFLDSDDMWHRDKMAIHERHLLEHPACVFSFTHSLEFLHGTQDFKFQGENSTDASFINMLLQRFRVYGSGSSVLVGREFLLTKAGFDESLKYGEDWDLWLKLARSQVPCELKEVGTIIRVHPESMQNTQNKGFKRFSNSEIHFYEWEKYPEVLEVEDFDISVVKVLWAEIRRNSLLRNFLNNALRDYHQSAHPIVLEKVRLDKVRFFKFRIFIFRIAIFLRELSS